MTSAGPLLALALAAAPYPPPRVLQPTPSTKCDRGTVVLVDTAKGELKATTAAGVVTYRAGADVQLVGADGKPAGSAASLAPGARVRIYYVLEDGAKVQEIDLEDAAPPAPAPAASPAAPAADAPAAGVEPPAPAAPPVNGSSSSP